jgi:DNA-binding ferritin-like protein (Dps family)
MIHYNHIEILPKEVCDAYISTTQYIWHFNLFATSMQLYFNLKFEI